MGDDLVLYYNPQSRARIAHWMLEELGQPYRVELLSFALGEHKRPQFLAINPMGKLPALVHRGVPVTESAAICAYLADAFPAAGLAPAPADPARAPYLRWLFFGAGCIEPALIDRIFARPPVERPGALGYGSYGDTLAALEGLLAHGPWVLGERFSAADVYIGSQIRWGMLVGALESRPLLQSYDARCAERPASRRVHQQSEEYAAQLARREAAQPS